MFDLTTALISARVHPTSHEQQQQQTHRKAPLIKTRSLEKDFELRIHPRGLNNNVNNNNFNSLNLNNNNNNNLNHHHHHQHNNNLNNNNGSHVQNRFWRSREEHQRRTRSLERNHRYLVSLDASCRYSREVGSTQVHLDLAPVTRTNSANSADGGKDSSGTRYHPDPTFKPPTARKPPAPTPSPKNNSPKKEKRRRPEERKPNYLVR